MGEPTDAEVEAVARSLYEDLSDIDYATGWESERDYEKYKFRNAARAAIIALDEVRGK